MADRALTMASPRKHLSHHDDPGELPLLTETARVTDITPLDHNRSGAVRRAAASTLERLDRGDLRTAAPQPDVDWDGVAALVDGAAGGPELERLARLVERYRRPFPSLLSIRLDIPETPFDFVPGQYVAIRFEDVPRPYSLACSPNADHLELCIRRVPGGRLTAELFADLQVGDRVTVRGPNGEFVMADPSPRSLAFMATGTGVAPLRSMIQYTFEENRDRHGDDPRDVWLFLGAAWRDDLPFREYFADLATRADNFHFVPTLSREPALSGWDGETAFVQETFLKYLAENRRPAVPPELDRYLDESPARDIEARIDPTNLEVYACGVSAMVHSLLDVVAVAGVPDGHVHAEAYG